MSPDKVPAGGASPGGFVTSGPSRGDFRRYAHRWLLIIPFIWQIGLAPFVNTAAIRVFSLPLPMVWQMCGILVATVTIAAVFRMDERLERAAESAGQERAS